MKLADSYKQTQYQLAGHGKRNIEVLKEAFDQVDGEMDSDIYGEGHVIESFERKIAALLGKERAVFFPSGTMAQQAALRIWCDEKGSRKIAYHPLCHLEIHEEDGPRKLHHFEVTHLADETRVIEMDDLINIDDGVSAVLLELPQRELGGRLPSFETLQKISAYCREKGIRLHLDGARLLEVLPYYKKTASEVSKLFDSVYLSFYKGIGGIAGAILAGEESFVNQARVWKRRHGGDLICLYPYIIPADHFYEKRKDKMADYYVSAKELAKSFNACNGVTTIPAEPVSNMFHVHLPFKKEEAEAFIAEIHEETAIGLTAKVQERGNQVYFELSLGDNYQSIPKDALSHLFTVLENKMKTSV
ncbi:threonine aldolase [Cytobacillus horneckiae]|uniref:threonine aldolase family protein n=1 Tax=Cytobacillus horneckiae TaxID=549687 RepID=UPI0019D2FCE9|nr:aminotransferase class I/II-fold pyridoxal phosphate-dependent enzyme [Cytobacillus horneckiae]MBN6886316.1 aminotransferase class I/II-fold pyridoxal phosphate-dependent enzyme [Cytobacillus horneckiae]